MPTDLNFRIAIETPQRHTVYDPFIDSAESGSAFFTELQSKAVLSNIGCQELLPRYPFEFI